MHSDARPWSVPIAAADIPDGGGHYDVAADEVARAAIAELAGLRSLSRLEASFDLVRNGEAVVLRGQVSADVGQTCVVTLEPIDARIAEPIDLEFAPVAGPASSAKGDAPEPLENGMIDLGAVATEFLLLGIDPYPRKPGAEFKVPAEAGEADKPFAALAALKKRP